MRILFASGIDGACHRYAVLHWAEQLATQDVDSTVRAHTDPRLAADVAAHDVLVLYRVPDSAWVRHLLARARAHRLATVFAVDDLIVDPATAVDAPPVRHLDADARRLWIDGVERYRRTLLACDAFLATSPPLAAVGRALGKPTYLHPDGLSADELALGAVAARAAARRTDPLRLGYFSGTATHDDDVAPITPVLAALLARHPALELLIVGPLALDGALARFGPRIVRRPLVPWPELSELVAATAVSLAPLEWRHPFVAAKGAVKYLEAAVVGVPIVASPIAAFRDAIGDDATGLLADDPPAWEAALERLIGDDALRRRLGAAARADVERRFSPAPQGEALAAMFGAVVAARGGRPSDAPNDAADELALARAFPGEVARAAREPRGRPGFAALDTPAVTPPLGDGVLLSQRFRATGPGLARVDVHTVTYGLALDHELDAEVRRDDGRIVARATLPAALAPDRDWLAVELETDRESAGRGYTLELRARGTGTRNALSFGATAEPYDEGPFLLAGAAGRASLALRTFQHAP